jgi:hypothetical protein
LSDGGSTPLRTVAFAELDASVWGAAWTPGPDENGFMAVGAGERSGSSGATLRAGDGDAEWLLEGDGVQLTASPMSAAVATGIGSGFDQLCRVHGRANVGGAEREIDCIGRRGGHGDGVKLEKFDSVRDVSAWFAPEDGLALVALRPRRSRGQDSDLLEVAVLDPEATSPVEEPRLSTTYTDSGQPLRAGFELWFAGEDEDSQYPRRAAGEAAGLGARSRCGGFSVVAQPFRWHSRGRDGAGVYLVAQRA